MDSRGLKSAALVAAAAAVIGVVAMIALRPPEEGFSTFEEAIQVYEELERRLLEGKDPGLLRNRLLASLKGVPVDPQNRRLALGLFADGDYEGGAAALSQAQIPFDLGLRGACLFHAGRKSEAVAPLKRAVEIAPPGWKLDPLFRDLLARAGS